MTKNSPQHAKLSRLRNELTDLMSLSTISRDAEEQVYRISKEIDYLEKLEKNWEESNDR